MSVAFAETSFLCAAYREQINSHLADTIRAKQTGKIAVSPLVLFEFRQSVRLQVRLHGQDRKLGFTKEQGAAMLRDLQSDLADGIWEIAASDWPSVFTMAEMLSAKYTETDGHRFADILHVATALQLGIASFLTFDSQQARLARAEGLQVMP